MHARWRHLLEPMSLAAYLAWGAIGVQLVTRAPTATGLLEGPLLLPLVLGMHASFLVLFVAVHLLPADQERPVLGLVLAQAVAALAMLALVRDSAAPILLIIAMAQVAQLLRPRGMALVFVAVNTVFLLELLWFWKAGAATWVFLVSHASFQLFAMVASWYAITARRSRDELAALNADLLSTRSLLAESVRDSERLRLARELHDVAGHKLTALKLNLAALRRQPELSTHAQLALCGELADELLGDLRAVVQQMRLHDGVALRQILEGIAAPFPRPRLHLEMAQGLRVETFEQAEAVVRTVQEALTNSARHGTADNLWLSLRREGDALRLELRDDGRGSGKLRFGNGLTGIARAPARDRRRPGGRPRRARRRAPVGLVAGGGGLRWRPPHPRRPCGSRSPTTRRSCAAAWWPCWKVSNACACACRPATAPPCSRRWRTRRWTSSSPTSACPGSTVSACSPACRRAATRRR